VGMAEKPLGMEEAAVLGRAERVGVLLEME
jgi:hypothetical protein